jgi:formimidoylglutamate deiminase
MTDATYRARYVLTDDRVLEDAAVEVADGRVRGVDTSPDASAETDLGHVALVPGRVNAHSHAFQRAFRGRTEFLEADRREDDFWSWREKMYRAALSLDPDDFEAVARFAFLEMLRAGFTTVGEFQYVHHDRDGEPYDDPNELAKRLVRAAREVGLRINLLRTAYHRAGYQADPNPRQRRFLEPDLDTYLRRFSALSDYTDDIDGAAVGLAPHSIRAVPGDWLVKLGQFARSRELPLHIHACEQRAELEQSRDEYGATPIEVFADKGLLSERTAIVHATHASETELDLLADHDSLVCACPTTERNLGDGFLPARRLADRGVRICLGTDSHADIDPFAEMRLVEYHERLRAEQRNVLASGLAPDDRGSLVTASHLWPMGGRHGAEALDLDPAAFEPDSPADFLAVDLDHLAMAGTDADSLRSDAVFSTQPAAIRDVFVDGEPVVRDGRHPDQPDIVEDFRQAVDALDF